IYVFIPVDGLCHSCVEGLEKFLHAASESTIIKVGVPTETTIDVLGKMENTHTVIQDRSAIARSFSIVTVYPKAFIIEKDGYRELPIEE
ncbi:MAG: hypothetical protein AAF693_08810, partial [Bacteroidota bacterium]